MSSTLTPANSPIRPPNRSFNSWDSVRYSQRHIPTIDTLTEGVPVDTFEASGPIEAQTIRRASVRIDERDPVAPTLLYRLGWRSYLQIWAALATTTTFCIASANLYARLNSKRD